MRRSPSVIDDSPARPWRSAIVQVHVQGVHAAQRVQTRTPREACTCTNGVARFQLGDVDVHQQLLRRAARFVCDDLVSEADGDW